MICVLCGVKTVEHVPRSCINFIILIQIYSNNGMIRLSLSVYLLYVVAKKFFIIQLVNHSKKDIWVTFHMNPTIIFSKFDNNRYVTLANDHAVRVSAYVLGIIWARSAAAVCDSVFVPRLYDLHNKKNNNRNTLVFVGVSYRYY